MIIYMEVTLVLLHQTDQNALQALMNQGGAFKMIGDIKYFILNTTKR